VRLPESQLSVTYYKPDKSPRLLAKRRMEKYDPRTPMRMSEFLAKAWKPANDTAREIGWIVSRIRPAKEKKRDDKIDL
jgi:hypothetical protein